MLLVQHPNIRLPNPNHVTHAVIDNLGFILEIFHERKICAEEYVFITKIAKYLERIYIIIFNKFGKITRE